MAYINCPKCGSINRDSDTNCFSCTADLTEVPPPPPPPPVPAAPVEEAPLNLADNRIGSGNPDQPRFRDLANRYVAKPKQNLDANALHGIRSGILGGLLMGALFGLIRTQAEDDTLRLLSRHIHALAARHPKPLDVVLYSMAMDLGFGILLGGFLGLSNRLCFQPESARVGAAMGLVGGGLIVFLAPPPQNYFTLVIGLVHGYALAWLISIIEKKVIRGE